ncbi:MAG: GNAT family N-acetyltransferase [Sphingomonadales bacterium]|nr:GNAT family N-acetyltransferase [Sphingomonadales bacterium]
MRQQVYQRGSDAAGQAALPLAPRLINIDALDEADILTAWADLSANAAETNAFCEYWFLLPALRAFAARTNVRLFTLWEMGEGQGRLAGLMPLAREAQYGRWPLPHIQNWLHPNAFLGVPLVRRGYETAFWNVFLDHVDGHGGQDIFLHLNGLTIGGALQNALGEICSAQGRRMELVHRHERAFLKSELSPQLYYENAMRTKKRKELRRQKNRLAELGTLSFNRAADDEGLEVWIDEFLTLERRGWKGQKSSAMDCADETRSLFRQALTGAARQGKLERLDLRLDKKPIAMLVNFICQPGSFSFKTAFDEDYARYSPGVLLQIENLDLLLRGDVQWCDSCAAEGHPMIDSLWTERRAIGRYSLAIGGRARRAIFALLLQAETAKMERKRVS